MKYGIEITLKKDEKSKAIFASYEITAETEKAAIKKASGFALAKNKGKKITSARIAGTWK